MSKTRSKPHLSVSAVPVFSVILLMSFNQAASAAGPGLGYMPIYYQNTESGPTLDVDRYFGYCYYQADVTSWCSHYTPTVVARYPMEYDHFHFSDGYPFTDTVNPGDNEVTKEKATWDDEDYWVGWTKVEDPTCEYNCHGYAMAGSSGPCIASTSYGSDRWRLTSGYTSISEPVASCIGHITSHSWSIDSVWSCSPVNLIRKVSEKDNGQGAYEFEYSTPGDAEDDGWDSDLYEEN